MVKKILSSLVILTAFSASILFADMIVPASALPSQAVTFIKKIYPNAQIWKVERDGAKFDVELSNGASVDFLTNGDWVNIDGKYNGVPFSVLPQAVANTVKKTYPQAMIVSVEKEWGNYKVKLNNMMEMFISSDGSLMGQQFDD